MMQQPPTASNHPDTPAHTPTRPQRTHERMHACTAQHCTDHHHNHNHNHHSPTWECEKKKKKNFCDSLTSVRAYTAGRWVILFIYNPPQSSYPLQDCISIFKNFFLLSYSL